MNKLISALLLTLPIMAQAEVIAISKNVGGGKIALTDQPCETGAGLFAYGTAAGTNIAIKGCWVIDEDIQITWQDGDFRVYNVYQFEVRKPKTAL